MQMSVGRASLFMIATLIGSRFLGWLRLSVIGAQFGQTPELDAFWAAFRIPDTLFNLLVAGALASAFIPVFTGYLAKEREDEAWRVASSVMNAIVLSLMGFSAILLWLGVIGYRQADFPFAVIEIAVATPIALYTLYQLWRTPSIARMLGGYALTLLAFLFFGRYFQGNYLGYILAVATPIPFLGREARPERSARRRRAPVAHRGAQPARSLGAASAAEARSIE